MWGQRTSKRERDAPKDYKETGPNEDLCHRTSHSEQPVIPFSSNTTRIFNIKLGNQQVTQVETATGVQSLMPIVRAKILQIHRESALEEEYWWLSQKRSLPIYIFKYEIHKCGFFKDITSYA